MKTANELRGMSLQDMQKELDESSRELFNLRMQLATGQLSNVAQMKKVKRGIACIKTVMNETKRAAQ